MHTCTQCTGENRAIARFCKYCGQKLEISDIAALDRLIGLDDIKAALHELKAVVEGMKLNQVNHHISYNSIIIGSSGTAKSLIGSLLTELLFSLGVTTKGTPTMLDCHVGSAMKDDEFEKSYTVAKGGVFFIDNAHKLISEQGEPTPLMHKIVSKIDKSPHDPVFVLAGLPFGFREFTKQDKYKNITGRFQNILYIANYSPSLLVSIAEHELAKSGLSITPDTQAKLLKRFCYLLKEAKKTDSLIQAHNGFLAIQEARKMMDCYFRRRAGDKLVEPEDITGQVEEKKSVEEIMRELDGIIGMDNIKDEVKALYNQLKQSKEREALGIRSEKPAHHFVITGNPGTGKTTIARLLGSIFEGLGLLDLGHVVEVDRSKLVAGYIGQTAPLANRLCDQAMGGILFVDEAYTLVKGGGTADFGQEAIDALLKRMEDDRGKFMVVVAGYKDQMESFLSSNPGLKSRFTKYFNLEDYTPEELTAIFEGIAHKDQYTLDPKARERVIALFTKRCASKTRDFANGREARQLFQQAVQLQGNRLATAPPVSLQEQSLLTEADIPSVEGPATRNMGAALGDLNRLIGLERVKGDIRSLVDFLRVEQLRAKSGGKATTLNLHTVFRGNPGTGKTTVARMMGEIYAALGILSSGHVVEVDRGTLVAQYVGHTAPLVHAACDRAMGGILFVDEAYTLKQADNDSFGQEAIDTLLKRMEDDRGKYVVIAAGYVDEMHSFVHSNPGLQSRFTRFIDFDDYNPSDMLAIFKSLLADKGMQFAADAETILAENLDRLYAGRGRTFANARVVRNLFEKSITLQGERMCRMLNSGTDPSEEELKTLVADDIPQG